MFFDILIEGFFLVAWNDVPGLGLTEVVVVDGVQEKIFDMPAEGGELHSEVHPR